MQQTPNFNSKQIISKEELTLWDESVRELVGNVLRYNRNSDQVGGILDGYDSVGTAFINDFFKVEIGSVPSGGFNTIKIGRGRGVLNFENTTDEFIAGLTTNNDSLKRQLVTLFKYEATDNIVVDGISGYASGDVIYIGFVPIWNPLEDGLCALTTSNQVTITGGNFTKLRGQSTKNPTKIRFYNQDGTAANNSETYEVISILSDTQIIISGVLSNETNLKFMIVGSYDLSAQGSLANKYSYVTATGQLTFTDTASEITSIGGFLIASLTFASGGAFSINDLRVNNLFNFAYSPDIVYKSMAQAITGQKTFSTSSPIFAIPVIDKANSASFSSPLLIPAYVGGAGDYTLTIPSSSGNVFQMQSRIIPYGSNTLTDIVFAAGYVAGTKIYILVDPTGDPLYISSSPGANSITAQNRLGAGNLLVEPGTWLEFWADLNLNWHLTNMNAIKDETDWITVTVLYDGDAVGLSTVTNIVKYKLDRNNVHLYIDTISATVYPVTFALPYNFPFKQRTTFIDSETAYRVEVNVNTDGTCSIDSRELVGTVNKLIPLHL
jgi:hypothetical protein